MRRALAAGATGVAALAALAVAPVPLAAGVILVPGEERTVASAMLRAAPGDTIVVEPGRYFGPIELKSNVRLVGLRGPSQTFLYLDAPGATLRSLGGGPATALVGFTLQGTGTGVEVGRGALQIYDCRFEPHLRTGLRCAAGGHVRLFASVFENLPLAVDAQPGADLLMMRNTLSGNSIGLRIGASMVRVYRNEFLVNAVAVEVLREGSAQIGGTLRDANGFLGSRTVALRNHGPGAVPAAFNYWGTVDCDSVAAGVEGPVNYLPMARESRRDSVGSCP